VVQVIVADVVVILPALTALIAATCAVVANTKLDDVAVPTESAEITW
jgi:hypothetical protein